jgi:signal transduction histidine kinase/CheY-like chemotaxis protein
MAVLSVRATTKETTGRADALHAEQVGILFRQMPIAVAVNFVNTALAAAVLLPLAARPWVLPWFAVVILATIGRLLVWQRYRRDPVRSENTQHWSRLATCASLLTGLCWGIGGAVLYPLLPVLGKVFLTLVIGGMCAGAVVISASHLPTLLAFVLSASLPMAARFFMQGSAAYIALAAMVLVFAAALVLAGRHFSQTFAETMRLRFALNAANLRLQAEMAEHRATEAALRQAQRMEALGQLTGGLAHDFNNLLTVVVGNATLLHDAAADEKTRQRAASILAIAERGERLTRQLLAFSRRRVLHPEIIRLQERAGEIAELLARAVRENIEMTVAVPDDLWPVAVDFGEFELAVLNVAVNARDAMPEGGKLQLAARNTRCDGTAASGGLDGAFVAITLTDTGTGMPAEVMAHAFEPYFTTKEAGLGSGLGLSQVYGFASQSGGGAVIASAPGEGTAITLFLPRAGPASAASGAVPSAANQASAAASGRLLLVEDDREVAAVTQELLCDLGFETRWAEDGSAALEMIADGPPVDLVLSDVVMPGGVSGLDLARRLRECRPELPVVLATGYSRYAAQVIAEGFRLIEKPYRRTVLAAALQAALAHRPSA